ncbi:MAG: hypothetical protein IJV11_10115 [Muribaculaceae bacterium]|nr:hypothetical protein [Muribaculaceae bacterium]
MKLPFVLLFTMFSFAVITAGCKSEAVIEDDETISREWEKAIGQDVTKWFYGTGVDETTNEVDSYNAAIVSKNACRDKNGNKVRLVIQLMYSAIYIPTYSSGVTLWFDDKMDDSVNALCKFSSSSSGFLVKFDDEKIDKRWNDINNPYLATGLTPNRDGIAMNSLQDVLPFIYKLKSSKRCEIKVDIEGVGMSTFVFDVDGLKWDYED